MKFLPTASVFFIKKYLENVPKSLCSTQCYIPYVKQFQAMYLHDVSNKSIVEWHGIKDIDYLKTKKFVSGIEDDKLQTIVNEIRSSKFPSPEFINTEQLRQLCILETRSQRVKYLIFLFKREQLKIRDALKKENKKAEREKWLESKKSNQKTIDDSNLTYGLGENSLLLSIRSHTMHNFYHKRLANAVLFGKKIVVDLDYDQYMVEKERKACVAQLTIIYSINRKNTNPFDLYFCNANPDTICVQYLKKLIPTISDSLVSLTNQTYLDIFPKESLVYLSPHAKETLKEYDPNAVYIIGAFVDTVKRKPMSLNKAETEGIRSYSLPLDDYIMWGSGTKSLTINQAFEIMLTLKNTGDWIKAFQCVPSRKIKKLDSQQIETNLSGKIFLTNTS